MHILQANMDKYIMQLFLLEKIVPYTRKRFIYPRYTMLKKTVLIVCSIGIAFAATIIIRYLHPATTSISTNIDNIDLTMKPIETEIFASWLQNPRSIIFTNTDRVLVSEKKWSIKQIINWVVDTRPILQIQNISQNTAEWLMDIALDPQYTANKYLYTCYMYTDDNTTFDRVSRWTDLGDKINDEQIIIDKLPAIEEHAWCAIAFGPDRKLYITVGDAIEWEKAQYADYLNGKILRINSDWSYPSDNPYPHSPVRSIWLRNSQWIDRDSKGTMYASDQGPSIFDGQPGGDEINHIVPKGNYGRNKVSHEQQASGYINPLVVYTPAIIPATIHVYRGSMFPERKDIILVTTMSGKGLLSVQQSGDTIGQQQIIDWRYGNIRYVTEWPDGSIYVATNNSDDKNKTIDSILRIYKK